MLAGIRDILIITNPEHKNLFQNLLMTEGIGVKLTYQIQEEPRGIADAFIVGEEFLKGSPVCLIQDNLFYGTFYI